MRQGILGRSRVSLEDSSAGSGRGGRGREGSQGEGAAFPFRAVQGQCLVGSWGRVCCASTSDTLWRFCPKAMV